MTNQKLVVTVYDMNGINLEHITESLRPLAQPITRFHLDPLNARHNHDLQSIARSLQEYGQRTPIVANMSEDGRIIKGNGTYEAATQILGWDHIAAVLVEDDPLTATGYAIVDNRSSDKSEFNEEVLA